MITYNILFTLFSVTNNLYTFSTCSTIYIQIHNMQLCVFAYFCNINRQAAYFCNINRHCIFQQHKQTLHIIRHLPFQFVLNFSFYGSFQFVQIFSFYNLYIFSNIYISIPTIDAYFLQHVYVLCKLLCMFSVSTDQSLRLPFQRAMHVFKTLNMVPFCAWAGTGKKTWDKQKTSKAFQGRCLQRISTLWSYDRCIDHFRQSNNSSIHRNATCKYFLYMSNSSLQIYSTYNHISLIDLCINYDYQNKF